MLWIALEFPHLSLDAVNRCGGSGDMGGISGIGGHDLIRDLPIVVTDGPANRPLLHAINAVAREVGMNVGMTLASARAMESSLVALPRDPQKETQCVLQIAAWCSQFTPSVSINTCGVVLEVSASLRLFGGITKLAALIRQGMVAMGYRALIGIAPTPLAAQLLAKMTQYQTGARMCQHAAQLNERLASIPLPLFDWSHETLSTLSTLGLTHIKDVLAQPREGLRRRFGESLLSDLDRAIGKTPDPRLYVTLPDKFRSDIELVFELIESERLLHPIAAMLTEMEGFLRARGAGVTGLVVLLKHSRDDFTEIIFDTRTPARDVTHWLRLIRERFNMISLKTAVIAITLKADRLCPYEEINESFFPSIESGGKKRDGLMDRLTSRLGEGNVFSIAVKDDHRPESAWQIGAHQKRIEVPRKSAKHLLSLAQKATQSATPPATPHTLQRPTWLLREPRSLTVVNERPQYHGALTILAGPERIETGWWDNKPVARDYFVATNPRQEVCWIFRDYRLGKRWYLHGLFS
jgi:protein ImuB